jgi:hypothetical protein
VLVVSVKVGSFSNVGSKEGLKITTFLVGFFLVITTGIVISYKVVSNSLTY